MRNKHEGLGTGPNSAQVTSQGRVFCAEALNSKVEGRRERELFTWMFKLSSDELEKYRNKYREKRCDELERFFNDHFPGADINDFK